MPCIIKEEFDSPGCTREVRITALLIEMCSGLEDKFVMITISQSFPAMVFVKTVFRMRSLVSGVHIFERYTQQSL